MPEDDKVRRLLMGIQNPSLQTAVLFVRSTPALRGSFDAAVDSITTVVETIRDNTKRPFSQISSTNTEEEDLPPDPNTSSRGIQGHTGGRGGRGYQGRGGRGRRRGGRGGGGRGRGEPWTEAITTRWYQGHELARMSDDQRHQMREMREGRQVGSAETSGQHISALPPPPQYQYLPPYPYLPPPPQPMMPPLPPPPPPTQQIGAVHQHSPYVGNRGHHGISRFDGAHPQGFAPGPPRF
jgi:hypothetical protein